jgi:ubiquinol-cytochrome c reductase cytochrome c1 subunit
MMIKKIRVFWVSIFLVAITPISLATEVVMQSIPIDITNKERLQRGAKLFMNYCSGCHSLKYMRYNRMAEDLGLTDFAGRINKNLLNNLIFTRATVYDPIQIAMPPEDARQWFGIVPPDLSLSARERGAHWLYLYLKNFYNDDSRPFGVNNLLIPNVAMPNALESLMGQQILVINNESHSDSLLLIKKGEMLPVDFDNALHDLVTFLVYVGEPAKLIRYRLGIFAILFLSILLIAAYCLKKTYWRRLN